MSDSDIFAAFRGLSAYTCETAYVTRVNATEQRSSVAGPRKVWDLEMELSDAEREQVEAFFAARNGPYDSFLFLDPMDNLLRWSEDFAQAAWQKTDPSHLALNGSRITNSGPLPNVISQPLAIADVPLCGSIYLKDATGPVTLRLTGATEITVTPGSDWMRYVLTGAGSGFEIELPAGASVDLSAAQVITGQAPGAYVRTGAAGGCHAGSYFDWPQLQHRALGPDRNRVRLRIACPL